MFSVTNILIVCYSLKESLLFVPKFRSAGFSWGSAVRAVIAEVMYGHGWSATQHYMQECDRMQHVFVLYI